MKRNIKGGEIYGKAENEANGKRCRWQHSVQALREAGAFVSAYRRALRYGSRARKKDCRAELTSLGPDQRYCLNGWRYEGSGLSDASCES